MSIRSFVAGAVGGFLTVAASAQTIDVEIVNQSAFLPADIWVLVTGDNSKTLTVGGLTAGTPVQLSGITNQKFTVTDISSGRIFFSYKKSVTGAEPPTSPVRYDKVELTYPGAANLTAVDFFSIPFRIDTLDSSGNILQTLNYYSSGNTLKDALAALAPAALLTTTVADGGPFNRVLSPTGSPSSYPSMQSYVNSVIGKTIAISGTYVGSVGPTPNTYTYTGTFGAGGTLTLTGTMTQAATPANGTLVIEGSSLAAAIYTNNGPYTVNGVAQQVSNNDVYAAIYASTVGAFDFGYVDGKYGNDSAGWYGTTPFNPPYAEARKTADGFFNQYASIIANASDAYGFPFSDLNQPVQVALNPGGTSDVATMRITILPDDALDAPTIKTATPTNDSITLTWDAVTGATSYTVEISPPLPPAKPVDKKNVTSAKITGLKPGTPYTVSVVAENATKTSAARPVVISTTGSVTPVTGNVTWNFIPNFTGTFTGHTITFNGTSQALNGTNTALQFNNVPAEAGQQNAYVFTWKDGGTVIYSSVLYVTLEASPTSGMGTIDQAPAATFLNANLHVPTYAVGVAFNLFLSIQPTPQRTIAAAPKPKDPSPVKFGSKVESRLVQGGAKAKLSGSVSDADGIRTVRLRAGVGKHKQLVKARVRQQKWIARIRTDGKKRLRTTVIVTDDLGNVSRKRYRVRL